MSWHQTAELAKSYWPWVLGASVVALVALGLAVRSAARAISRRSSLGIVFATLGAALATLVSTNTSWRFFADFLGMRGTVERSSSFTVAEVALFACALLARENLLTEPENPGDKPTAGTPGVLVWVISGVACVPAFAEGHGLVGGIVRSVLGPLGAAVLWHLSLGVELRMARPKVHTGGMLAQIARQVRERVLARLGMAEADRDAVRIARDRAIARAVELVDALSALPEDATGWHATRRRRRLSASLRKAIRTSGVALDASARDALLAQVAASRNASALATIPLVSPWDAAGSDAAPDAPVVHPERTSSPVGKRRTERHADAVRAQVRDAAERYRTRHHDYPSARTLAAEAKVRQGTASAVLAELKAAAIAPAVTTANGHALTPSAP